MVYTGNGSGSTITFTMDGMAISNGTTTRFIPDSLVPTYFLHTKPMLAAVTIEKVIYNPPATIVLWSDGTKTVTKATMGDRFNPEFGLALAITKKYIGSRHQFKKIVREAWIEYLVREGVLKDE